MKVKEWMTRDPVTVSESSSLENAYRLLTEYEIRHLPVVEDGKLVGIVSDRDIGSHVILVKEGAEKAVLVSDIMTKKVVTVGPDDDVADAALLMRNSKISGLPVVERGRKLVGILTTNDILEIFVMDRSETARKE